MIFFAELNKTDGEHTVINRCMLDMLCNIFKGQQVVFWGSRKHFENLTKGRDIQVNTHFVKVLAPKDGDKLHWIKKYAKEAKFILDILRNAKKQKVALLFFSSLSVFGSYAVKLLSSFFPKVPIIITLHGELEYIKLSSNAPRSLRLMSVALKKTLYNLPRNIKVLVLGSFIKEQLIASNILNEDQIIAIEHPYHFADALQYSERTIPSFGHIGIAKRSKHSELFFKLAEFFREDILAGRVSFKIVGLVWKDLDGDTNSLVEYADTRNFLSRDVFEERMKEIDYAIFLYGDDHYSLTGSGALMDALSFHKPILCLRNRYFGRLYSTAPAEPGWIFDHFEELKGKVKDIIAGQEIYSKEVMRQRFKDVKKMFSLEVVEEQLAQQLQYLSKNSKHEEV